MKALKAQDGFHGTKHDDKLKIHEKTADAFNTKSKILQKQFMSQKFVILHWLQIVCCAGR